MCDDTKTTHTDSDTLGADSRRPFTGEGLGVIEPIRVVLPGNEAGTYRAIVCEDLDEAAFWLVRHLAAEQEGNAVTSQRAKFNYAAPAVRRVRRPGVSGHVELNGAEQIVDRNILGSGIGHRQTRASPDERARSRRQGRQPREAGAERGEAP